VLIAGGRGLNAEACGDLGIDEVFERLSPEPVAAASLGQVYKGTLRANGAVVAVKVQRPGVEPQVLLDLYLLRYVAERSLNDYALKNLGVQATLLVDEFGAFASSRIGSIWARVSKQRASLHPRML
jgi:predicted unusual protein kinase regulating ubiquinone biosynthesis (AarF/ABC1/UbiB family)